MTPPVGVLSRVQERALGRLGSVLGAMGAYYLVGGTAVALQLGHRRSVDLDWFTEGPIGDPLRLAREIQEAGIPFRTTSVERGTLHGSTWRVKVSILEYRYPLLKPVVAAPDFNCSMASLADLVCMKLAAVAQRGSKKDFVDVYALGVQFAPLHEMLQLYRQKYAIADIAHVLYGLTYFDDADRERLPRMAWSVNWRSIKATIQSWVRDVGPAC